MILPPGAQSVPIAQLLIEQAKASGVKFILFLSTLHSLDETLPEDDGPKQDTSIIPIKSSPTPISPGISSGSFDDNKLNETSMIDQPISDEEESDDLSSTLTSVSVVNTPPTKNFISSLQSSSISQLSQPSLFVHTPITSVSLNMISPLTAPDSLSSSSSTSTSPNSSSMHSSHSQKSSVNSLIESKLSRYSKQIEDKIKECGVDFCILQCDFFLQNLKLISKSIKLQKKIAFPSTQPIAWLDSRDAVEMVVDILLSSNRHTSKVYKVSGPELITCEELCDYLSTLSGGGDLGSVKVFQGSSLSKMVKMWNGSSFTLATSLAFSSGSSSSKSQRSLVESLLEFYSERAQHPQVHVTDFQLVTRRKLRTLHEFVIDNWTIFNPFYLVEFELEEINSLYNQFIILDRNGDGILDREEFSWGLGFIIDEAGLGDALFNLFDADRNNVIDFQEYLFVMSTMMKGTIEEKLQLAFNMYDQDRDGYITWDEFFGIAESLERSLGNMRLEVFDVITFMSKLFQEMDKDKKGKISEMEYKEGAVKNLHYIQSLGLVRKANASHKSSLGSNQKWISFGHESWDLVQNMLIGTRRAAGEAAVLPEDYELSPSDFKTQKEIVLVSNKKISSQSSQQSYSSLPSLSQSSQPQPIPIGGKWVFKDFAPMVFRKIRELFSISSESYMFSLGPERILGNLLLGNISPISEVVSTGRSGSFFYKSSDHKYFIKTIPSEEEATLKKFLTHYYRYLLDNPNTFLTRFYGLHQLRQEVSGSANSTNGITGSSSGTGAAGSIGAGSVGREISFVVMANLFDSDKVMHEQYDLKGSTVNRKVDVDLSDIPDAAIALKDCNFKRKVHVGLEMKARILEQIEKDCKFLESFNICDYSLLIGFHFLDRDGESSLPTSGGLNPPSPSRTLSRPPSSPRSSQPLPSPFVVTNPPSPSPSPSSPSPSLSVPSLTQSLSTSALLSSSWTTAGERSLFRQDNGGLMSASGTEIYFIGIIDNLTTYSLKKYTEHAFKSLIYDPTQISAIPPTPYRARFQKYVHSIFD